ncbi:LapA family protein [Cellulomonas iranensis]|jgi:uncharacterized integral membrane protein|uniref:LapA family protein n=2 Tax=Cellulomonas TaxID=1707 RepID=UPI0013D01348|nr:lipopolysaccharide assembly protein LapA domain-containing protein [Cellulomonas iranensis]
MPVHRSFPARPTAAGRPDPQASPADHEPSTPEPSAPEPSAPQPAPTPGPADPEPIVPEPHAPPLTHPATAVRSRTGAAWVGICVGALVLVALVVFMMQNTAPVEVAFLGMSGSAPLALVLLIAGLGVGVVALVLGSTRIAQLRRLIRSDRRRADVR